MREVPRKSTEEMLADLYEVNMSIFVQISRIYDLLAAQASKEAEANSESIEAEVLQGHEEGLLFGPIPALKGFVEGSDSNGDSDESDQG